jgi:hypothetical protein
MTLEGRLFVDATQRATDVQLAGGADRVYAAGRIVVEKGRVLELTNESPAYRPSLAEMTALVARLDKMGLDLSSAVVTVFAKIDATGVGAEGTRYLVAKVPTGVELVPG